MKDKQAIAGMTEAELRKHIRQVRLELMTGAISRYMKQEKNQRQRKALRLKKAVMATALRQKELYANK